MRAGVVAVFALGGLLAAWLPTRQLISAGISLTTTNRAALNYRSLGSLAWELGLGIGLLIVVALVGGALFWRESPSTRRLLTVVTMVGAGLALPISQMRLHEYTSFNKHLAFAALFLAPLAAQSIARRGRPYRMLLIFVVTYVLAVGGLYRSATLFSEWPDSTQVSQYLQTRDEPGQYVAVDAETMAYESPDHPELQWTSMFALYGAGPGAIHDAVGLHEFTGFIYRSGSTGDNSLDSNTAYLDLLLRASPNYQLVATFPVHQYDQDLWYVWIKLSPGSNGGAANHPEAARPATP
jgi:hypothetical protein